MKVQGSSSVGRTDSASFSPGIPDMRKSSAERMPKACTCCRHLHVGHQRADHHQHPGGVPGLGPEQDREERADGGPHPQAGKGEHETRHAFHALFSRFRLTAKDEPIYGT